MSMFTILPSCPIIVAPGIRAALIFLQIKVLTRCIGRVMLQRIGWLLKIDIRRNARWLLRPTALPPAREGEAEPALARPVRLQSARWPAARLPRQAVSRGLRRTRSWHKA